MLQACSVQPKVDFTLPSRQHMRHSPSPGVQLFQPPILHLHFEGICVSPNQVVNIGCLH
jgi:hypothetical protein